MNDPTPLLGCAAFEHEIADLVDGALDEAAARRVRVHLAACAGCRAWHAEYAATDALLQAALPTPALSPGFDAALQGRIQALQTHGREERRAAAEAEHERLVTTLRGQMRSRGVLGALSAALTAGCSLVLLDQLFRRDATLHAMLQGTDGLLVLAGLGVLIVAAFGGWALSRSAIMTPSLLRR